MAVANSPDPSNEIPITWVNGERSETLNVLDRGLAYGDGLFETMRYQGGVIPLLSWHWRRLQQGAVRLGIPLDMQVLNQQLAKVLIEIDIEASKADGVQPEHLSAGYGVLKLIVTRGNGGVGYKPNPAAAPNCVWSYRVSAAQPHYTQRGVALSVSPIRLARSELLGGLKHLNRLEYVMASRVAELPFSHQWLLLDDSGAVIEALTHNLFWLKDGDLYTPDLTYSGVAGVMRQWIIEQAQALGFAVRIGHFSLADVLAADEVFMCNSLRGVWPVFQIEHSNINPGPVAHQLQCAIDQLWQ